MKLARDPIDTEAPLWSPLQIAPSQSLRMFGMRRSGNHAIADWLLRNAGGSGTVFFNNCVTGKSPLAAFATLAVNRARVASQQAKQDLGAACTPAGPMPTVLVSYEDVVIKPQRRRPLSGALDHAFDFDIIVYRSFLNWCASFLKKLQKNDAYSCTHRAAIVLRAVDTYARTLDLLKDAEQLRLTGICYDDWLTSEPYRADCLAKLGMQPRDNSVGHVQPYGGGSSFQGRNTPIDALQTTHRFEQMAADEDFQTILQIACRDTRLRSVLARVFPRDAAFLQRLAQGGAHHA